LPPFFLKRGAVAPFLRSSAPLLRKKGGNDTKQGGTIPTENTDTEPIRPGNTNTEKMTGITAVYNTTLLGLRTLSLNFGACHPILKPKSVPEMGYGIESWWMYFVWCSDNSFHGIGMPFRGDLKSGIKIFTRNIYTQGKILK
jgi:hypothetical protein